MSILGTLTSYRAWLWECGDIESGCLDLEKLLPLSSELLSQSKYVHTQRDGMDIEDDTLEKTLLPIVAVVFVKRRVVRKERSII